MKTTLISTFGTLVLAASMAAQAPAPLTDADIEGAIKAGMDKKFSNLVSACDAHPGFGAIMNAGSGLQYTGTYDVVVSANLGRIASLAAEAKRLYKPFALADIGADLRAPAIFVSATPVKPTARQKGRTIEVASPLDSIVLKSKTSEAALQPVTFATEPVEWANVLGGKLEGTIGVATFSYDGFRELPPGDVDIVLITKAGERRCKIGTVDRTRLYK